MTAAFGRIFRRLVRNVPARACRHVGRHVILESVPLRPLRGGVERVAKLLEARGEHRRARVLRAEPRFEAGEPHDMLIVGRRLSEACEPRHLRELGRERLAGFPMRIEGARTDARALAGRAALHVTTRAPTSERRRERVQRPRLACALGDAVLNGKEWRTTVVEPGSPPDRNARLRGSFDFDERRGRRPARECPARLSGERIPDEAIGGGRLSELEARHGERNVHESAHALASAHAPMCLCLSPHDARGPERSEHQSPLGERVQLLEVAASSLVRWGR